MALTPAPLLTADDRQQLVAHWFAEFQGPLFRYLVRMIGDEEHAADVLQETFLRGYTALARQLPPTNPRAWLHRIATNLALNTLQRQNRWRWLPLSGHERAPSFENDIITAETVRRCLARMRAKEVEALLLFEYAGFSTAEIAALTNETPNAIRLRISRARARFTTLYQKEIGHGLP